MAFFKEHYVVESPLDFAKDKHLLGLSDLHYGSLSHNFHYNQLYEFYRSLVRWYRGQIDMILIPGDLLFCLGKRFDDKIYFSQLQSDLRHLAQDIGAPICISLGNHDLPFSSMSEADKKNYDLAKHLNAPEEGIFVLDNEQKDFDDICVTGFSPVRENYLPGALSYSDLKQVHDQFSACGFGFDEKQINILLSHENKFFTYPEAAKQYGHLYDMLTLILGGHLHDGYVPLWLQHMCKGSLKDYGICEKFPPNIDMCRGAFVVSKDHVSDVILNPQVDSIVSLTEAEAASIILRGVAKYSWFLPSVPTVAEIDIVSKSRKRVL